MIRTALRHLQHHLANIAGQADTVMYLLDDFDHAA